MRKIMLFIFVLISCSAIFFAVQYMDKPANKKIVDTGAPANKRIIDPTAPVNEPTNDSSQNQDVQASTLDNNIENDKYELQNVTSLNNEGKHVINNPDDLIVLVNKTRNLPSDWVPKDLVVPNVAFAFKGDSPRKYMREAAAKALEELFSKAKEDNINILATSGYRSYDTQKRIFTNNAKIYGEEEANKTSAYPGQSEHQTGLAMDITSAKVNYKLEEVFGDTVEGKWLKQNAAEFGFIIRYLKGKEDITKYSHEPWHVRYVGKEAAKAIMDQGITLEEYLNAVDQ